MLIVVLVVIFAVILFIITMKKKPQKQLIYVEPAEDTTAAPVEETSSFDVILISAGDYKINVIKEIREITRFDLVTTKNLVESAPAVIKKKVNYNRAKEIKAKLEAAGATVELK